MEDYNFNEIVLDQDLLSIEKNFVKDCIFSYNSENIKKVEVKDTRNCCEKLFFYIIGDEDPDW